MSEAEAREVSLELCKILVEYFYDRPFSIEKYESINIDLLQLLQWFTSLPKELRETLMSDQVILKGSLGYENYCTKIIQMKKKQD